MKRNILTPTSAVLHAAETGTGTTTDDEPVRKAVAKHELIDAAGTVVEDEEAATGIRYTLIKTGKAFDYQIKAGQPGALMLAIFGAKTLATNEASQVRQKEGEAGDQLAAIEDRFALIDTGKWVDRTGGGGAAINLDALAQAVVQIGAANGKTVAEADVRKKLEDDKTFRATVRAVPAIATKYSEIVGKTIKSVDDVFSLIG